MLLGLSARPSRTSTMRSTRRTEPLPTLGPWSAMALVKPYLRLIAKLNEKVNELEMCHKNINDVYSSGAVEGYSDA